MDLTLTRYDYLEDGVFGTLTSADKTLFLSTLEHAYANVPDSSSISQSWTPKIPQGVFQCLRGFHQLEGMVNQFETFEIIGIEGHTGLLFHVGNYNADSSGCVLLGMGRKSNMIINSRQAFGLFMDLQDGINEFCLTVI